MKRVLILITAIFVNSSAIVPGSFKEKYADAYRGTPELAEYYGYNLETHTVTTEDGYILTVHRIPTDAEATNYKGPIILQHGLIATSAAWTISGPNVSFAFLLNKEGYDVWLPNLRGNFYSRSHVSLSKDDPKFWEFSWHESGIYDLPAIIDYVLDKSGSKDLIYIGHSMGCTASYVLLSLKPEYNEKIRVLVSLSPAVAMSHATSLMRTIAVAISEIRDPLKLLGVGEMFQQEVPSTDTRVLLCAEESVLTHELCNYQTFYIAGTPRQRINQSTVPNVAGHYPAGTGRDMIAHFGQGMVTGKFAQFDYGVVQNVKTYGQSEPPLYPIEKVTAPTYIFHGASDTLADPTDVERVAANLGNVKKVTSIPDCGHVDMNYAKDADKLVYYPVIELLESISQ